jgi:hypothetical protein
MNNIKKIILCLILISVPLFAFGQNNKPKYFLNGVEIDFNSVFFNEKNIAEIKVLKEPYSGSVSIITKNRNLTFKTLNNVLKESDYYSVIKENSLTPVFIINGTIIDDTSKVKIEDSFFTYVSLKSLQNIDYLTPDLKRIFIVYIECFDPKIKFKNILIRGDSNNYINPEIIRNKK